ncbi:MAG: Rieske 2Fe-2S domain-containing protein [Candidatus Thiodiazotropha sp.]|jgi:nitrite reductase/ring-hydroxylating ferredoxin subunit
MSERSYLCCIDDLTDPGSRGFSLELPGEVLDLVLVKRGDRLLAYRNRCPHTGVNLEWRADQFLDPSECYIQCATHGALFRIEDGHCLRGPCVGQQLQPLKLTVEDGKVYVEP